MALAVAENPNETLNRLRHLVVEHVKAVTSVDQVVDDADLALLGLDSMSGLNLLLDIEEMFEVSFPEEYLTPDVFRTPATLVAAIMTLRR
jgi:acyl carrier protein